MSPRSAYPDKYVLGKDNRSWLMRQKNKVQVWFTGGPRVPKGFWKFREVPTLLFYRGGEGLPRWENSDGSKASFYGASLFGEEIYLSRIQCWTRWHISFHKPYFLNFHVIYRLHNVPKYPTYKSDFGITKMLTFHIGWKRDSDRIYKPTVYIGGNAE